MPTHHGRIVVSNRKPLLSRSPALDDAANPSAEGVPTQDQGAIFEAIQDRLIELGWELELQNDEAMRFENLIPPPDVAFRVKSSKTNHRRAVALNLFESEGGTWFACAMKMPDGTLSQEQGYYDRESGTLRILSAIDDWACDGPESPEAAGQETAVPSVAVKRLMRSG